MDVKSIVQSWTLDKMKNLDWLLFWGPCQACDSVPFDFLVSTASREGGPGHSETWAPWVRRCDEWAMSPDSTAVVFTESSKPDHSVTVMEHSRARTHILPSNEAQPSLQSFFSLPFSSHPGETWCSGCLSVRGKEMPCWSEGWGHILWVCLSGVAVPEGILTVVIVWYLLHPCDCVWHDL